MGLLRAIFRPRATTTLALAATSVVALNIARAEDHDPRAADRAEAVALVTMLLTVMYGTACARPSRGRLRAAVCAGTAVGAGTEFYRLALAA